MIDLDDVAGLASRDPGGMRDMVAGLASQLGRARAAQEAFHAAHPRLPPAPDGERTVLVCGMGGSAIGGDLAAAWAERRGLRIAVHRGYGLPAWVGPRTLVVFSSYSGDTEETLSAFEASGGRATQRLALATGGALAGRARAAGLPVYALPGGLQPRAALGHSLTGLLVLLHASGLVADPVPELEDAARRVESVAARCRPEVPEAANPAKRLARRWHGRLPVLYSGGGLLQPVALRWKGQIQENAKQVALAGTFPEVDHNEIMGWQAPPEVCRVAVLTMLRDRDDGVPVERRMAVTAEILAPRVAAIDWIDAEGDSPLERMLGAVALGDWGSLYLAFLNGVDPTPVTEIVTLKSRLAAGS